jgi:hypothetical protein
VRPVEPSCRSVPLHVKFELYKPSNQFHGMAHNLQWLG